MMAGASIYWWRSKALRQRGGVHAIAIGNTPDEARARIRIHAREWLKARYGDAMDEIAVYLTRLDHDLDAAPEVGDVHLLIGGSA